MTAATLQKGKHSVATTYYHYYHYYPVKTYAVEHCRGVVVVVVVPETARGDADVLQSLLTDESLHDDFVSREVALSVDAGLDGVRDGGAPALAVRLVELLAIQLLGHALGDDVAHLLAPEAGGGTDKSQRSGINHEQEGAGRTARPRWGP
ncbi:hypothetical protein ON010_g17071 [Phytophthora cinnamomi]|nr:hypothetical protein ON010_g17071 [Phytophthora cinnamomi]